MDIKKYNQIIDEVYNKYATKYMGYDDVPSKELFLFEIKNNPEFSEKWGLKIEERELSLEEKEWELQKTNCINDIETDRIIYGHEWEKYIQGQYEGIESTQGIIIPTKLITVTYNDKTIESYE
jgi:hypothetical protein